MRANVFQLEYVIELVVKRFAAAVAGEAEGLKEVALVAEGKFFVHFGRDLRQFLSFTTGPHVLRARPAGVAGGGQLVGPAVAAGGVIEVVVVEADQVEIEHLTDLGLADFGEPGHGIVEELGALRSCPS